jgi:hypothetical protein
MTKMKRRILRMSPGVVNIPFGDRCVSVERGAMESLNEEVRSRHSVLLNLVYESAGYAAGSQDYASISMGSTEAFIEPT